MLELFTQASQSQLSHLIRGFRRFLALVYKLANGFPSTSRIANHAKDIRPFRQQVALLPKAHPGARNSRRLHRASLRVERWR